MMNAANNAADDAVIPAGQVPVASPPPRPSPKPNRIRRWALWGVPALVMGLAVVLYLTGGRYVSTDNAYLKADKLVISTEVSGLVQKVFVRENQAVEAGELLFQINPQPFEVAVYRAEARLAETRAELAALKASYQEKRAEVALAQLNNAYWSKEQARLENLSEKGFSSANQLDDARHSADVAAQNVRMLELDLHRIAEELQGDVDAPYEQHPRYRAASAELRQARLDLERTSVRASLAGTVSNVPTPGQYLAAGNVAMVLVGSETFWVEANFKETEITHLHAGQHATIHIDTYPGRRWEGRVESLSPATGTEFSVIPAQNATGNWVKVSQRVAVRIRFADPGAGPVLRSGLSSSVEVDTGNHRLPELLL